MDLFGAVVSWADSSDPTFSVQKLKSNFATQKSGIETKNSTDAWRTGTSRAPTKVNSDELRHPGCVLCVCITRSDDFRLCIYAAWARGAGDIGPPRRPEPTEELQLRVRVTGESAEGAGRGSRRDFGVIVCGTGVQCLPLALRDTRLRSRLPIRVARHRGRTTPSQSMLLLLLLLASRGLPDTLGANRCSRAVGERRANHGGVHIRRQRIRRRQRRGG
jgi:hypothetical protein